MSLQGGAASPRPGLPSNPAIDVPELKSMDSRRSVKLRELLRECAAVKFDLQKGPLFRINLFKVCLHCLDACSSGLDIGSMTSRLWMSYDCVQP